MDREHDHDTEVNLDDDDSDVAVNDTLVEVPGDGPDTLLDAEPRDSAHRLDVGARAAASTLADAADTDHDREPPASDAATTAPPLAGVDEGRAAMLVPDAPQRRVSAERNALPPGHPWWSWRGWGRGRKILAVTTGVLLVLLVTGWLMLPTIVGWVIRQQLPEAEKELGRKIDFGDVELHGLSGLTLTDVVVYDADGSSHFIDVGSVTVSLTKSPVFHRDFKVESIEVVEPEIHLVKNADGSTNYADFQEKLEKLFGEKKKSTKKKKPSPLGKYLKPLPRIEVVDGAIELADATAPEMTVERVADLDLTVTQPDFGAPYEIALSTEVGYRLGAMGSDTRRITVNGFYKNKTLGELEVGFEGGLDVPFAEQIVGVPVRLGSVKMVMPATFVVDDLVVGSARGLEWPVVSAETVRVELTQFPPKKIGGVYITETDIQGLFVDMTLDEAGRTDFHAMAEAAIEYFVGPEPTELQRVALAIERQLERGARAGAGKKQRKDKGFDIADYFFSQRIAITDSTVRIDDRSPGGAGQITLDGIELLLGYRPIQKRVELELSLGVDGGTGGKLWLGGGYDIKGKSVDARLDLDDLSLAPLSSHLQALLVEDAEKRQEGAVDEVIEAAGAAGRDDEAAAVAMGTGVGKGLLASLARALRTERTRVSTNLFVDVDIANARYGARGRVAVADLELVEPRLSRMPLDDLDAAADFELTLDPSNDVFDLARLELELGSAKLSARAHVEPVRGEVDEETGEPVVLALAPKAFDLALTIPEQPAQDVIDGIPYALRWALDGMRVEGTFGFELTARGRSDDLADADLATKILGSGLRVVQWPSSGDISALNHGMTMKVLDPRATVEHTIEIPPSTHASAAMAAAGSTFVPELGGDDGYRDRYPDWVLYKDISPWLIQMITTTEDGSFFRHAGFSSQQIMSALADNVDDGGFKRGASTISMQLVKNVYLGRQKTLARKLQETILTWLMESVVRVPKARILEVYFNVIEFGPEVYGIGPASRYYFGKRASDLTLREAAFLVSIIPRPRTGESHRVRGTVTERKSERMNWFIEKMFERKCDPDKLARLQRHYDKRGEPVPIEFCCPPPSLAARLMSEPVTFYMAALEDPEYRPDLYDSRGNHLGSPPPLQCDVGEDGLQGEDVIDDFALPDPDAPLTPPAPLDAPAPSPVVP